MTISKKYIIKSVGSFSMVIDISNTDSVIKLNQTASVILNCIKDGLSADDIAKTLCEEYDITEEKAREDVEKTISELIKLGVIED